MERNNLKKITGSRWFLPVVCAVSFVFGWWYLSITTCAPLGGDDEIINLQNYYYITHTPWWQVVLTHAKEILNQLALQSPRFRPFSSPPVRSLNSWFLGDLVVYRLFLAAQQIGFGLQHLYAPQVHTAGAQPRTGLPPGEGEVPQSGGTGQKCQHFVDHLVMQTLIKRALAAPACSDRSGAPAFRNTLATGAKKAHTPFGMTPKSFQMAFPCS